MNLLHNFTLGLRDYVGKDLLQVNQRSEAGTVLDHGIDTAIAGQLEVGRVDGGGVADHVYRNLLLFHLFQHTRVIVHFPLHSGDQHHHLVVARLSRQSR